MESKNFKIAIIGLGYVGLPLAVEFGKKFQVIGFDIHQARVDELNSGHDATLEVEDRDLQEALSCNGAMGLKLSTSLQEIEDCNVYIVTVPTPIDKFKRPDLTPLVKASETVGKVISKGDIVIYESTVYPGATEEDCIPVVEKVSGLKFNEDFFAGYSPERINPGDKVNTLLTIKKVTSGSTPAIATIVDDLYNTILLNGTKGLRADKVAKKHPQKAFIAAGKSNLNESAEIIRRSQFVVSSDTGLMHIAAAYQKKIYSVWGNTVPEFGMYPYMPENPERSIIVEIKGLACRPCSKLGYNNCPKKHFDCMMKQDFSVIKSQEA